MMNHVIAQITRHCSSGNREIIPNGPHELHMHCGLVALLASHLYVQNGQGYGFSPVWVRI